MRSVGSVPLLPGSAAAHAACYRAPGDSLRSVLQLAHLGQILLHYHDSALPQAQVDSSLEVDALRGSDHSSILTLDARTCSSAVLDVGNHKGAVCARVVDNRTLARFAQRPSLQSQTLELTSAFQRGTLVWSVRFSLTEDGQIRPGISLSGRASETQQDLRYGARIPGLDSAPLTRATILANWRLVFDLDTPMPDHVEQFEFPLDTQQQNRRPMRITPILTESLHVLLATGLRPGILRQRRGVLRDTLCSAERRNAYSSGRHNSSGTGAPHRA